jgi:fructosamine-3-kinase
LPERLREALERRIGVIRSVEPVSGGSVSMTRRVRSASGVHFLKYEQAAPPGFFRVEAEGLERLRAAGSDLVIPGVLDTGESEGGWSWLLLEWLEPESPATEFDRVLGKGLAGLHRVSEGGWGAPVDGFIGRLAQANAPAKDWSEFWWGRRLHPQLQLAYGSGLLVPSPEWERLREIQPALLAAAEADGPSLLHGDLWSGNVMASRAGPALVDPSVYQGHREVDLAMSELFGGFGRDFYASYEDAWPLQAGHRERRWVYQLYYLLVHVNLFGASYVARTRDILARLLAAA